jgi:hypothetical protein
MDNADLKFKKNLAAFEKNQSHYNKEVLDGWKGYSIICPSTKQDLYLKGTEDAILNDAVIFMVDRCSSESLQEDDLPCKSP